MSRKRRHSRSVCAVLVGVAAASAGLLAGASPAAAGPEAEGTFIAIDPCRLVDSRAGSGVPLDPDGTITLTVAGPSTGDCMGDIPVATNISAAVLNVTAIAETTAPSFGYLSVYPADEPEPTTSNVNFRTGEILPNLVTATLSEGAAAGQIKITNGAVGKVDYIVDVQGYYLTAAAATAGSLYHALQPCRLVDTREAGAPDRLAPNTELDVDVAASTECEDVPANATAVAVNTTAVPETGRPSYGFLTVYPDGAARPATSNLDFATGQFVSNLVQTKLGTEGKVTVYNGAVGFVDVILDVQGYYAPIATEGGSKYVPLSPERYLDTRPDDGLDPDDADAIDLTLAAEGGLPDGVTGVTANLTAVPSTAEPSFGYLTVFATDVDAPDTSNVNFASGVYISNLVMSGVSADGEITILSGAVGYVDVIVDVQGYFTEPETAAA